jgi:hypothetical protein
LKIIAAIEDPPVIVQPENELTTLPVLRYGLGNRKGRLKTYTFKSYTLV